MSGISDLTMRVVEFALDGLAARGEVRADNVANANTPGFQGRTVNFETALATALERGEDPARLAVPGTAIAPGVPDPRGNTVSMENELVGQMQDTLMNQALINAYDSKLVLLRTALGVR